MLSSHRHNKSPQERPRSGPRRAASPRRATRRRARPATQGGALIALATVVISSCVFDWDTVDPRADASTSSLSSSTGTSVGSTGGAASSSVSTSAVGGAGGAGGSVETGGQGPWFDPAWTRRRAIDVGAVSGGPHADFVVRVRLDSTRIDMSATDAGADLRFVSDDHTTVLPHQIERWGTEGDVWVRLPSLSAGLRFFMYYGNPGASLSPASPFSHYAAVWHLGDPLDASGSGAHGTRAAGVAFVPGFIGNATMHAPGMATELSVAAAAAINNIFAQGGTVSAWIRPDGGGGTGFGRVFDKATDTSGSNGWTLHLQSTAPTDTVFGLSFERGFSVMPANIITNSLNLLSIGQWHHIALVSDDANPSATTIYVDGQSVPVVEASIATGLPESDAAVQGKIGKTAITNDRSFDGLIDELRLEKVARSPGWIDADYRSGADMLLSFGPDEPCPTTICP